jgi:hypothetical protein
LPRDIIFRVTDQPDNHSKLAEDADSALEVAPDPQEPDTPGEADIPAEPDQESRITNWLTRKNVRSLRRLDDWVREPWDRADNNATRLPDDEEIHLAGLVLAEAFTPSTTPALYQALTSFPAPEDKKKEWADRITRGRSAVGMAGWVGIGPVRRVGELMPGVQLIDPTLPSGVEAAWTYLLFPTPSVTMLVTTFTLTDEAGDLSPLLRTDYQTEAYDVRLRIPGHLGGIRARLPWSRPKDYSVSPSYRWAEDKKRQACDTLISGHETACQAWLAARFPGTFSAAAPASRPLVRLLLTKKTVPFEVGGPRWLSPPGLAFGPGVWRSTGQPGWAIKLNSGAHARQFTATAAARRRDAAREHAPEGQGESSFLLTQQFALYQSPLVTRWAIACLLSLYIDRLAGLRDRPVGHRIRRPVQEALSLDTYLLGDGLDASTVTADVRDLTENPAYFGPDVPDYIEDMSYAPGNTPQELVPWLLDRLKHLGLGLERDTDVTTRNISASAGLRQAIANTRLQRTMLLLTGIAIAIAVISLFVAIHANDTTGAKTSQPSPPTSTASSGTTGSARPARR